MSTVQRSHKISIAGVLAVVSLGGALGIGTLIAGVSPTLSLKLPQKISIAPKTPDHTVTRHAPTSAGSETSEKGSAMTPLVQVGSPNSVYGYQPGDGSPKLIDGDGDGS